MSFKKWITGGYQAEALAQRLQWQLGGLALEGDQIVIAGERHLVKGVTASIVDEGVARSSVSAGRVVAGGIILGPAGMVIGALAKKHTRGDGAIMLDGPSFQMFMGFKGALLPQARELVAAINTAARQP